MNAVFGDTYHYLALMNAKDEGHERAIAFAQNHRVQVVTTAWVLTELGDGLCRAQHRPHFLRLVRELNADPRTRIVEPTMDLFQRGMAMFESRMDKDWSLTDCISFVVMTDLGLSEALTADHHFAQAGYVVLL